MKCHGILVLRETFTKESLQRAVGNGIIIGKESGTMIDPQGNTARSEAAVIIQRYMKK